MTDSAPLTPSTTEPRATHNKKRNIYISWEDLRLEVPDLNNKKETKIILNGLNGHVKPGELVAVIGPSGSGKSSFLNCIGGRTVEGVTGKIEFNGIKRPSNFARFTGYVVQDDLYFEALTVKETLTFAANLKLPMSMTSAEKKQRVRDVLDELDLSKCENTQIGVIGKGISGGERRRLAIGLEIINEPSLLLLDEPTSGLDSASALMVGKILKRLAQRKNITILCTIHQPRYSLATMFDKLYFLAKGNEIYFGPSIPKCLDFFERAGYTCPEYDNPADFLLDLVNTALDKNAMLDGDNTDQDGNIERAPSMSMSKDTSKQSGSGDGSVVEVQLSHVKSESATENDSNDEAGHDKEAVRLGDEDEDNANSRQNLVGNGRLELKIESKMPDIGEDKNVEGIQVSRDGIIKHLIEEYQKSDLRKKALDFMVPVNDRGDKIFSNITNDFYITPWYNQFFVILRRSFLHKFREPIALMTQTFNCLIMPVLFGSVYFNMDLSQQASLDRISAISLLVLMLSFFAFDILMLFPVERAMFNRENAAGMYRPSSFYMGRTFAEMPQHIVLIAIMGTIAYFMYGLQNDLDKFLVWILLFELTGIAGTSMLLAFGAFAKTLEQSNLLATFWILLFMLFDGNWISLDKVPVYWRWIRHISLFAHGVQGCIANEYRGLEFKCTNKEIDNDECFYRTGNDVLYVRGLDNVDISDKIWALVGLIVGFRFLAFIGVLFLFRNKSSTQILKEMIGLSKS